jgi:ribonucrease Y
VVVALCAGLVALFVTALVAARAARADHARRAHRAVDEAKVEASALTTAARLEAAAVKTGVETAARREALDAQARADAELATSEATLATHDDKVRAAQQSIARDDDTLDEREARMDGVHRELQSRRDRARGLDDDVARLRQALHGELESRAGIRADQLAKQLAGGWIEDARARAAAQVREIDQTASDPEHERQAQRVMEIASGRCAMHFLTERSQSTLRVGPELVGLLLDQEGAMHRALEQIANVQLHVNDDRDAVRLEGLDGVGREVVRRALHRLIKKPETIDDARRDPQAWATKTREHLTGEIRALGKKAFQVLGIQKAHPEIVELVGALNFRTSYTQNQWLHAVEASFLAGMMAAELGLDEKLARRATLMHDIGKALTHKIEGSHAVIGADIARRLGEPELIANAIGAHHADEPCNSVYAYLVAASDAMSGARPGARRELAEGFTAKIEDLERIGLARRGVSHAHAVHGGRELRVYVRERDVDDVAVVEMSTEIAAQIADEMTFPGQIKVTVIRAFEATATAN